MKNFVTLEVGKTYKNRVGDLVKIVLFKPQDAQPFSSMDGVAYSSDGRYLPLNPGSRSDLVELIEDDIDELLNSYALEMSLFGGLTLSDLICSHRTLRTRALRDSVELQKEMERYREIGREQGHQEVTNGKFIEVEKLKSMTLQELAEFISS